MKIYSEESCIKSYHVDKGGKLSIVQVFNFLQEAAFRHSVIDNFGQPNLDKLGMVWVLSRINVVFLGDVVLGESVEINSWIRSINGALSERDFELNFKGKPVIKATSLWICLDVKTIKPVRIPKKITDLMEVYEGNGSGISTSKISELNGNSASSFYTIQPSDIDMVNHTNNVVYVKIGLDALHTNNRIKVIDVNYLNQSFEEDTLEIKTGRYLVDHTIQEIVNESGDIVCRLRYVL